jgi:membrane protease YdiL (CAAX protease family)
LEASKQVLEKVELKPRPWHTYFIVFIGVTISICEYVFAYQNVTIGIALSLALALVIYSILSAFRFPDILATSAESLALIPLYILFTSSLPWFFLQQQYLLPAVYSCVLALAFWHIYRNNLSIKTIINFDRRKLLRYVLVALAIGAPLGLIEYLILRPSATAPFFNVGYLFRDTVYMVFFVGLGEELLFRGLIQTDLSNAYGWKWGLFGTSLLFAVMHMTWRSLPELGFVFLAALVLGGIYIKTKSLVCPVLLHATNNVILVAVMPYILGR